MDRSASWRAIEPDETPEGERTLSGSAERPEHNSGDGLRLAAAAVLGAAAIGAIGVFIWSATPQPQVVVDGSAGQPGVVIETEGGIGASPSADAVAEELVVDVQGAVARSGLQRLAAGSRVGDAIQAAGGYSPQLDIQAAAEKLNLAERLVDGTKIYVPALGDSTLGAGTASGDYPATDGADSETSAPIDLNTASQAQLETLPGIGPVTAGKIITAREEEPFSLVDDLLARKVVGPATFEKIRQLITVAP